MSFLVHALDPADFAPLSAFDDATLQALGARRVIATSHPGFPCRIALEDASIGDELILLHHAHLVSDSPYRASGPIFVRPGAERARLAPGELPACVQGRVMSVRAYGADDVMIGCDLATAETLVATITRMFEDARVRELQLHNAKAGCFAFRVTRAPTPRDGEGRSLG